MHTISLQQQSTSLNFININKSPIARTHNTNIYGDDVPINVVYIN